METLLATIVIWILVIVGGIKLVNILTAPKVRRHK